MLNLREIFRKEPATTPDTKREDTTQLALWDTEAIENGYKLMSDLDLAQAGKKFIEAINSGIGDRDELEKAEACCRFWKEKLDGLNAPKEKISNRTTDFLKSYREYPFTSMLQEFKKQLLEYFTGQYKAIIAQDSILARQTAGLLFLIDHNNSAVKILEESITHFPEDKDLQYTLARAYWLKGDFDSANEIYLNQLLRHPDQADGSRIENPNLQKLIATYGANLALAYGTIYEKITLNTIPEDLEFADEAHRIGVECLLHIRASRQALKSRDQKTDIQHRKKLHQLSPEVCKAYIQSLQER